MWREGGTTWGAGSASLNSWHPNPFTERKRNRPETHSHSPGTHSILLSDSPPPLMYHLLRIWVLAPVSVCECARVCSDSDAFLIQTQFPLSSCSAFESVLTGRGRARLCPPRRGRRTLTCIWASCEARASFLLSARPATQTWGVQVSWGLSSTGQGGVPEGQSPVPAWPGGAAAPGAGRDHRKRAGEDAGCGMQALGPMAAREDELVPWQQPIATRGGDPG